MFWRKGFTGRRMPRLVRSRTRLLMVSINVLTHINQLTFCDFCDNQCKQTSKPSDVWRPGTLFMVIINVNRLITFDDQVLLVLLGRRPVPKYLRSAFKMCRPAGGMCDTIRSNMSDHMCDPMSRRENIIPILPIFQCFSETKMEAELISASQVSDGSIKSGRAICNNLMR